MMKLHHTRNGFTLIELVIYIGLSSMVIVALLRVMLVLTGVREKMETVSIVQQEGRFVMHRFVSAVQSAVAINTGSSLFNSNHGVLSLTMSGSVQPSIFTWSQSGVILQENGATPAALTSSGVIVDQLRFTNLSAPNARGTVRMLLHLTDHRAGDTGAYNDDISLSTSATLRY